MPQPYHPVDTQHVLMLLRQWLKAAAPPEGVDWLDRMRDALNDAAPDGVFFTAFAQVPRTVGTAALRLRPEDRTQAERARAGWCPTLWTADQAARTTLLLVYDDSDGDSYGDMLARLLRSGDRAQVAALYRALPLLPYPERQRTWALEALRADDHALFEAVALFNPYPADHFDETGWNRMILKAAFLGVPMAGIVGLERRANAVLAHELRDFARQRRQTGQRVPVCMWQAAGDKVCNNVVDELAAELDGPNVEMAMAAALALAHSRDPHAAEALARRPELAEAIRTGRLTWDRLASGSPSLRAVG
ncbi:EboA domain-containing protein [Azospirillum sp. sgz301742]